MRPGEVMDADANTGWRQHDALMVVDAVSNLVSEHGISIYIEQPCPTYEECLAVRQHTNLPFILDECIDGLPILLRGYQDRAMDLINLKISINLLHTLVVIITSECSTTNCDTDS